MYYKFNRQSFVSELQSAFGVVDLQILGTNVQSFSRQGELTSRNCSSLLYTI